MGKTRRKPTYDLDEVRPDLFLIGDPSMQAVLKGEGEISGTFFRLTTWRREGLVARLRERGFSTRTLEERLAELPAVPTVEPPGELLPRDIAGERQGYALFDPETLSWRPVEPAEPGSTVISLPLGAVVRRRRGRGASSYYRVVAEQGKAGLAPQGEDDALLRAFARVAASAAPEIRVRRVEGKFLLPKPAGLPPRYRAFVEALGESVPEGILVGERGWGLARRAYSLLGLWAVLEARSRNTTPRKQAGRPKAQKKRPAPGRRPPRRPDDGERR
jgi:hypothetical protein